MAEITAVLDVTLANIDREFATHGERMSLGKFMLKDAKAVAAEAKTYIKDIMESLSSAMRPEQFRGPGLIAWDTGIPAAAAGEIKTFTSIVGEISTTAPEAANGLINLGGNIDDTGKKAKRAAVDIEALMGSWKPSFEEAQTIKFEVMPESWYQDQVKHLDMLRKAFPNVIDDKTFSEKLGRVGREFESRLDQMTSEARAVRFEVFPDEAYADAVRKLDDLRERFPGIIDNEVMRKKLERFRDDLIAADDSLKGQLMRGIESWGSGVSGELADMALEARGSFEDIAKSFAKMALQIMIQAAIVKPFIDAIKGGWYGGTYTWGSAQQAPVTGTGGTPPTGTPGTAYGAHGLAMSGGRILALAHGDVLPGTTYMGTMANGTHVIAGEKGRNTEAAMPLTRIGPDLGVRASIDVHAEPVVVQVVDQRSSGAKPEVQQTQGPDGRKLIRVLIRDEVKSAIADGSLDKAMASTFGATRRGARR